MIRGGAALAIAAVFALSAAARQEDGRLGLVLTPNNGMPAVRAPGESFEITARREPGSLALEGEAGAYPLETGPWRSLGGGRLRAAAVLPAHMPPGAYALAADDGERVEGMPRAVFVLDRIPEYYILAHVAGPRVSGGGNAIVEGLFDAINASDAALCIVTGGLTEDGAPAQYRALLALLDRLAIPSYVVPGPGGAGDHYAEFFGPGDYWFNFGLDGYLAIDARGVIPAGGFGRQDGDLQRFRGIIKPQRRSIGLASHYDPAMGLRAQLSLFHDDPLDWLLTGAGPRDTPEAIPIPWGRTRRLVTPEARTGALRFIDMTARDAMPRAPSYPVPGAPAPEEEAGEIAPEEDGGAD